MTSVPHAPREQVAATTGAITVRTINVRVPDYVERMRRLTRLAWDVREDPRSWDPHVVQILLKAWATTKLPDAKLAQVWEDFVERHNLAEDLNDGIGDWRDVDPGLQGPDRTETAYQIAKDDAADLLHLLVVGAPAKRPARATAKAVAA